MKKVIVLAIAVIVIIVSTTSCARVITQGNLHGCPDTWHMVGYK